MNLPESLYLHGLNLFPRFGPARLSLLARNFSSFKEAYFADLPALTAVGIDAGLAVEFIALRDKTDLDAENSRLVEQGIKLLTFRDAIFPKLLLEIPKCPPLLYYKGIMEEKEELCLSVVGTRQITSYGRTILPGLVEPLVQAGVTIVSGMAFGVDSAAHEVPVKANRRTIAVLGGGLDEKSLYPKHHTLLAERILDAGGALLSEYPIGTPNFKQNFVARNRIISGMSVGTIIIECDLKSGTLITAKHALDQNRQVYAIPGPIYSPQSQGPNNLIKMGAKLITGADDIFADLNLEKLPQQQTAQSLWGDSQEESALLKLLNFQPIVTDELIKQSGLSASAVTSALTFLEMKGKVRNLGGQQYVLSR